MTTTSTILVGDCREQLATLPARSVHTVITSPPYFGLRDYGTGAWTGGDPDCDHQRQSTISRASSGLGVKDGHGPYGDQYAATQGGTIAYGAECGRCGATRTDSQIGLEPTPDEFVAALVAVFREVRRVLRDDGTVWLNLGDSYNADGRKGRAHMGEGKNNGYSAWVNKTMDGTKPKDLLGIPWLVAFALRADGWYLRSEIIWAKPNPMPESVTDRPTKAHEQIFLLSKGPRYFYDADAIREAHQGPMTSWREQNGREGLGPKWRAMEEDGTHGAGGFSRDMNPAGRNRRSVWTVATQPYAGAHFATFPPKLIEPCVLAGAPARACAECGAPWTRVVERERWNAREDRRGMVAGDAHIGQQQRIHNTNGQTSGTNVRRLGWQPSCAHDAPTAPGVVLDPFAGAGTVGVVCGWHGRDHVGIELSPAYADLARRRIALEGRPGGPPSGHEAGAVIPGQLGLLGDLP